MKTPPSPTYKELAKTFFKLGVIGFGGPAAHIAMMQEEIVTKRNWLTQQQFLDLVGATNLIPGPNSTEMAIHIGMVKGGILGLIIAGVSFIFPAITITGLLAWFYTEYGELPQVTPAFYGIKPAVLAIILAAVWKLGKTALKNRKLYGVAVGVGVAVWLGVNEVLALLLGGVLGMIWLREKEAGGNSLNGFISWPVLSLFSLPKIYLSVATAPPLWQLGLVFLKVGSVLFGGGYVLVAFLEGELAGKGWLTQQQLLDAIAIGQFTPGPVLSTATFIGYLIAGWAGAVVATVAIFFPSFVFVAISNPLIPRLRSSKWMSAFLDAVNVASVALMAVVVLKLGLAVVTDYGALFIAVAAAVAVIRFKVNAAFVVVAGAVLGLIFKGILV